MILSRVKLLVNYLFVTIIFAPLLIPALSFSEELKTDRLFWIERSKNANIVCYDVQLTPEGKIDKEKPIVAYWIMNANNGEKEDLTWIEKKLAYGFEVKYDTKGDFWVMNLAANVQREIKVYKIDEKYHAEALIDNRPAIIEKIYVKSVEGGLRPKVEYMEFYGKCIKTGDNLYEKFIPI